MDSGTRVESDATAFYQVLAPILGDQTRGSDFYRSLAAFAAEKGTSDAAKGASMHFPQLDATPVESVDAVIGQVNTAINSQTILRVIGSKHSASDAIFSESNGDTRPTTLLRLVGKLKDVDIKEDDNKDYLTCRVGAGCRIGKPSSFYCSDETVDEKWKDSLCYKVHEKGYGIPILGGITYQTLGGFLMTGSAGGSLKHDFSEFIKEIEFVDGTGVLRKVSPDSSNSDDKDLWSAVGVSMGLFGIITHVTLRLPKVLHVQGMEMGYVYEKSSLRPKDSPNDKTYLQESLENNEYFRLNWFPQEGMNRVQEWSGKQVTPNDGVEEKPYKSPLSNPLAAAAASLVLGCGNYDLEIQPSPCLHLLFITGLKLFVPVDPPDNKTEFNARFYLTLPMDNDVHVHTFIRVEFTEIWMPISHCEEIIAKLNALFKQNRKAAGNFATEIYAAKQSNFWLGMSYGYGGTYVRVDPYWWQWNHGDKREFFTYFWNALIDVEGARFHWGKYMPTPGKQYGSGTEKITFGLEYLKSVYPKLGDWLELRKKYDPHQVFVTQYWRDVFSIAPLIAKK